METRVEKFKKYREEIIKNKDLETNIEEVNVVDENVDYNSPTIKKNTLTMSIDKIIEAHDEYNTNIELKELEEKNRLEQQEKMSALFKSILRWVLIGVAVLVIVAVIIIIVNVIS